MPSLYKSDINIEFVLVENDQASKGCRSRPDFVFSELSSMNLEKCRQSLNSKNDMPKALLTSCSQQMMPSRRSRYKTRSIPKFQFP